MQPEIRISVPKWVDESVDWNRTYDSDEDRADVAIALARRNVTEGTGGPFGAAVFVSATGRIVSAGVNLVVPLNNSSLHAEVVAFMLAQARLGRYSLGGNGTTSHELVTSCEPCAMCLGATLWSGVHRLVCCASGADARDLAFDEGPVFPESWQYLADRGIEIVRGVRRDEARAVMETYCDLDGTIYNAG
ncbi:MAG: nucleoside deaminase [Blastocatellia bacterium]|nr:nucleoside deaminase [Blastocatellia bacterium]MBK6426358.1 nucleoside deaminase [Blastocatellia bacterium]